MNIIADLHTHTLFSDHAFNTATEMINQAVNLGLKALAITDHGPLMPDSGHLWHFFNNGVLPKKINGTIVLYGAEVDAVNVQGELDIPERMVKNLDWAIVSIHREIIPSLTKEEATQLWLNVAENPYIDMIGHCEQNEHYFDYDAVIPVFAEKNKVVEINANSQFVRPSGQKNMIELIEKCKKYNCKIAVNSDAHSIYKLGQVGNVVKLLEDMAFPEELVINSSYENLIRELEIHKKGILEKI